LTPIYFDSVSKIKTAQSEISKTPWLHSLRRQARNFEDITVAARWREHFWGFVQKDLLLNFPKIRLV